jgi:hypothetical protein
VSPYFPVIPGHQARQWHRERDISSPNLSLSVPVSLLGLPGRLLRRCHPLGVPLLAFKDGREDGKISRVCQVEQLPESVLKLQERAPL